MHHMPFHGLDWFQVKACRQESRHTATGRSPAMRATSRSYCSLAWLWMTSGSLNTSCCWLGHSNCLHTALMLRCLVLTRHRCGMLQVRHGSTQLLTCSDQTTFMCSSRLRAVSSARTPSSSSSVPVSALSAQVAVLIVLESAVQGSQLPQLQALVLVPSLVCGHQQFLYHLGRIIRLHRRQTPAQAMSGTYYVLRREVLSVHEPSAAARTPEAHAEEGSAASHPVLSGVSPSCMPAARTQPIAAHSVSASRTSSMQLTQAPTQQASMAV